MIMVSWNSKESVSHT